MFLSHILSHFCQIILRQNDKSLSVPFYYFLNKASSSILWKYVKITRYLFYLFFLIALKWTLCIFSTFFAFKTLTLFPALQRRCQEMKPNSGFTCLSIWRPPSAKCHLHYDIWTCLSLLVSTIDPVNALQPASAADGTRVKMLPRSGWALGR